MSPAGTKYLSGSCGRYCRAPAATVGMWIYRFRSDLVCPSTIHPSMKKLPTIWPSIHWSIESTIHLSISQFVRLSICLSPVYLLSIFCLFVHLICVSYPCILSVYLICVSCLSCLSYLPCLSCLSCLSYLSHLSYLSYLSYYLSVYPILSSFSIFYLISLFLI